jgi:hypothetical protein
VVTGLASGKLGSERPPEPVRLGRSRDPGNLPDNRSEAGCQLRTGSGHWAHVDAERLASVPNLPHLTRWLEPRPIDVGKGERAGWATRLSRSRWRATRGGRLTARGDATKNQPNGSSSRIGRNTTRPLVARYTIAAITSPARRNDRLLTESAL